jgi:hypothetical protein
MADDVLNPLPIQTQILLWRTMGKNHKQKKHFQFLIKKRNIFHEPLPVAKFIVPDWTI